MATYSDIQVPKFKSKTNRLYGDLLKRQLGYAEDAAASVDPGAMAEDYRAQALQSLAGDSYGYQLADETGDPGAKAAYELAQKNKVTEGYNDVLAYYTSPEGRRQIAMMKAGLFGPETLSTLSLLPSGYAPPKQGGGLFSDLVGAGATAAGMGWTPFG